MGLDGGIPGDNGLGFILTNTARGGTFEDLRQGESGRTLFVFTELYGIANE